MNRVILCIIIFFFSSLVLVGASPALPRVPLHKKDATLLSVSSSSKSTQNFPPRSSPRPRNHATRNHATRSITEPYPTSGKQRLLVITVEYPDVSGSHYTGQQWKTGMFDEFVSFYNAQSYGNLQYEVDVVTIDATGAPVINSDTDGAYIPLPSNITNYANNLHGWAFNTEWSLHTIVNNAATYLDSKGFDWTPYTQAGNKIQNVMIMSAGFDYRYAERAASNAASNYLLSTSYNGAKHTTPSGATLDAYTFCNEHTQALDSTPIVMAKLGQCAHEFGHGLGIPDLYDISAQSSGVGYFDIMGYGLYANTNDGSKPVGFSAWTKLALGWAEPQVIKSTQQVQLGPCSTSASNFLQIFPNASSTNYFLVENRQSVDTWDNNFASQLTNGIVIWHVDSDDVENYKSWNTVNTLSSPVLSYPTPPKPSMVVSEADGTQGMASASKSGYLDYGSSSDVWQSGRSYTLPGTNFRIVILAQTGQNFTILVNFATSNAEDPTTRPDLPSQSDAKTTPTPTPTPTVSTPSPTATSTSSVNYDMDAIHSNSGFTICPSSFNLVILFLSFYCLLFL